MLSSRVLRQRTVPLLFLIPALALAPAAARAGNPVTTHPAGAIASADRRVDGAAAAAAHGSYGRVLMGRDLLLALHRRVPAFSRQTKLACSACHYQFPQLTPFGRLFKLNGYTMTGLQTIEARSDSNTETLKLAPIPPAAAMVVTSLTNTARAVPNTQNNTAEFPQQFSLFLAGQVTPNVGAFTQFTYADVDNAIGIDNVDIRYASHHTLAGSDLLLGLTLHNNPTVQDVWNTLPAWGYPFTGSEIAPSPAAATQIEGAFAQQVLGFGAYSLWNNTLYTEFTAYRSAPQGVAEPFDSTATNTIHSVSPYWRVALQHQGASTYGMLGTFGLATQLYPTGVVGATNKYTDVGVDGQLEQRMGTGNLIGRASYIYENQTLDAFALADAVQNPKNHLQALHVNASYLPSVTYGFTLGYNQIMGSSDTLAYAPGPMSGFAAGSPNSSNVMAEFNYNPWENTRVGLQYIAYQKFNGASTNYDAAGRSAADNNTLYAYVWVAF